MFMIMQQRATGQKGAAGSLIPLIPDRLSDRTCYCAEAKLQTLVSVQSYVHVAAAAIRCCSTSSCCTAPAKVWITFPTGLAAWAGCDAAACAAFASLEPGCQQAVHQQTQLGNQGSRQSSWPMQKTGASICCCRPASSADACMLLD